MGPVSLTTGLPLGGLFFLRKKSPNRRAVELLNRLFLEINLFINQTLVAHLIQLSLDGDEVGH